MLGLVRKAVLTQHRQRTATEPPSYSIQQSILEAKNESPDDLTQPVGLAITSPEPAPSRSNSKIFPTIRPSNASIPGSHSEISKRSSADPTVASKKQTSSLLPPIETTNRGTAPSRRASRPRGPRDIRNTLEIFGKPLPTRNNSSAEPYTKEAETPDVRRTSSPLLPLESPPADDVRNAIDELSQSPTAEHERTELATQKNHDEDAMILWSLQKGREPRVRDYFTDSISQIMHIDTNDQDHESFQLHRNTQQEGMMEVQRSKSTSVSSSDQSSTMARGQSSTSTARQSISAASTTTHGSPPPQYLFDRQPKHTSDNGAEAASEQLSSSKRSEDSQVRPQTAPEEDRRPKPPVKQRFPVVPRIPLASGPQLLSTPPQPERPAAINPLQPTRSQTEPSGKSIPKSVNPPYRAPETSTFIRDASSFRPLPQHPRRNGREHNLNTTETCSCGKMMSPVANLTIEELRAQNAMLRAALEAVIGP